MARTPSDPRSWSLVDLGAAVAALLALAGVVWSPRLSGAVAKVTGGEVPVTVLVDVRGVPVADPPALIEAARKEGKVAIVIRNQPHGTVEVADIQPLPRRLTILTPDGRVVTSPDPNQKTFGSFDARFVLRGQGRRAGGGVVFGNQTIKVGAPVELEGAGYRFGGSVTGLTVGGA
jgi:hypothetical protein